MGDGWITDPCFPLYQYYLKGWINECTSFKDILNTSFTIFNVLILSFAFNFVTLFQ